MIFPFLNNYEYATGAKFYFCTNAPNGGASRRGTFQTMVLSICKKNKFYPRSMHIKNNYQD